MSREDEIRLIAYSIWEEENCPNGRDCEHWLRAETIWEKNQKPQAAAMSAKERSPKSVNPSTRAANKNKSPKG